MSQRNGSTCDATDRLTDPLLNFGQSICREKLKIWLVSGPCGSTPVRGSGLTVLCHLRAIYRCGDRGYAAPRLHGCESGSTGVKVQSRRRPRPGDSGRTRVYRVQHCGCGTTHRTTSCSERAELSTRQRFPGIAGCEASISDDLRNAVVWGTTGEAEPPRQPGPTNCRHLSRAPSDHTTQGHQLRPGCGYRLAVSREVSCLCRCGCRCGCRCPCRCPCPCPCLDLGLGSAPSRWWPNDSGRREPSTCRALVPS